MANTVEHKSLMEYKQIVDDAFAKENIDVNAIQYVILDIFKLARGDRAEFKDFYISIGDRLFEKHINIPAYKKDLFDNKKQPQSKKTLTPDPQAEFESQLKKLVEYCEKDLKILSKCVILKFGNDPSLKYNFILLHDIHSRPAIFSKVGTEFTGECFIYEVNNFITKLKEDKTHNGYNYIALLVLSPDYDPESNIIKSLDEIKGYFNPIEQIKLNGKSGGFYSIEPDIKNTYEEIKYLVSKDLIDMDLGIEVEKILKKMFSLNSVNSLQYRKISKGYSGTTVLYIQPSGLSHSQVRYIVKVGTTPDSIRKVATERINFKKHIDSYVMAYQIEPTETDTCVAIRYNYASIDGKISSKSFAETYGADSTKLLTIIQGLFTNALYSVWKDTKILQKVSFKHYDSYIRQEKLIDSLIKINGRSKSEVILTAFYQNFKAICELEFESYVKVCHGDLHTDNFFVDEEDNVFLIDFGDTDLRHSLIDYATLECSLKFKHIPRYIELETLLKIEEELLEMMSFQAEYKFQAIEREDLQKPFYLINKIRSQAVLDNMMHNHNSSLEYLYSLYMMTVRQINYDSLNQLYALKSAHIIGKKIIQLFGKQPADEEFIDWGLS